MNKETKSKKDEEAKATLNHQPLSPEQVGRMEEILIESMCASQPDLLCGTISPEEAGQIIQLVQRASQHSTSPCCTFCLDMFARASLQPLMHEQNNRPYVISTVNDHECRCTTINNSIRDG